MLGSGLTGTGSASADSLLSNGGPNTLVGLGGDDLYYVNNAADVVIEAANGGYDTVVATVDYTLPTNVEALYMIGSGLTGTGNSNDNSAGDPRREHSDWRCRQRCIPCSPPAARTARP